MKKLKQDPKVAAAAHSDFMTRLHGGKLPPTDGSGKASAPKPPAQKMLGLHDWAGKHHDLARAYNSLASQHMQNSRSLDGGAQHAEVKKAEEAREADRQHSMLADHHEELPQDPHGGSGTTRIDGEMHPNETQMHRQMGDSHASLAQMHTDLAKQANSSGQRSIGQIHEDLAKAHSDLAEHHKAVADGGIPPVGSLKNTPFIGEPKGKDAAPEQKDQGGGGHPDFPHGRDAHGGAIPPPPSGGGKSIESFRKEKEGLDKAAGKGGKMDDPKAKGDKFGEFKPPKGMEKGQPSIKAAQGAQAHVEKLQSAYTGRGATSKYADHAAKEIKDSAQHAGAKSPAEHTEAVGYHASMGAMHEKWADKAADFGKKDAHASAAEFHRGEQKKHESEAEIQSGLRGGRFVTTKSGYKIYIGKGG